MSTAEHASPGPLTSGHIDELLVPFDDARLRARVLHRRRGFRGRVVSLGITLVISTLLYFFAGDSWRSEGTLVVYGVVVGISLGWALGFLAAWLRARRALRGASHGTALRIGRPGIQVATTFTPWAEVTGLATVRRRGRGTWLELRRTSGPPVAVPLDQVDVHPATLDSTTRAYSGGRHGVDLSALEV